jgi:sugar phosphate isomerase/epimerase
LQHLSRRNLLSAGAAAAIGAGLPAGPSRAATPFFQRTGLPIGLQLYTLGPEVAANLDGALAAVAAIGFRAVQPSSYFGRTPAELRAAIDRAGLMCRSVHIQPPRLDDDLNRMAADIRTLGATEAALSVPAIPARLGSAPAPGENGGAFLRRVTAQLTADDWKMNADLLNAKGAVLKKAGVALGYHNHNFEFAPLAGGATGFEVLLCSTDPALVSFELDVGWAAAAGVDPLALLARHKGRFSLMHVKDLRASTRPNYALQMDPTEVGAGTVDWARVLPAGYAAGVRGFYVEQEPPFALPRLESAKISHDYLARLAA